MEIEYAGYNYQILNFDGKKTLMCKVYRIFSI